MGGAATQLQVWRSRPEVGDLGPPHPVRKRQTSPDPGPGPGVRPAATPQAMNGNSPLPDNRQTPNAHSPSPKTQMAPLTERGHRNSYVNLRLTEPG